MIKLQTRVNTPEGPQDWFARVLSDDTVVLTVPPSNYERNPLTGGALVVIPKEAFLNLGMQIPE